MNWDPKNESQVRGLILIRETTPDLYGKITARLPFMQEAVERMSPAPVPVSSRYHDNKTASTGEREPGEDG